jgi:uncharacterized membrane protein YidH (DUF202 family)
MEDGQLIREEAERDADPRIDLAVERTLLAIERTQLAWVRTVMGMITAGIAIDKGLCRDWHGRKMVTLRDCY